MVYISKIHHNISALGPSSGEIYNQVYKGNNKQRRRQRLHKMMAAYNNVTMENDVTISKDVTIGV